MTGTGSARRIESGPDGRSSSGQPFPQAAHAHWFWLDQRVWQESGFPSAEVKLAYLRGPWHLPPSVPDAVLDVVRSNLGARLAPNGGDGALQLQSASRASAQFETDRGPWAL
jgi:hypothetical protein